MLRFAGNRLSLNFSTPAVGTVRIELQRPDGTPIPGYTLQECTLLYVDKLAGVIQWRGGADISGLAGQPIRVRFELRDADLYAVQFTESLNARPNEVMRTLPGGRTAGNPRIGGSWPTQ